VPPAGTLCQLGPPANSAGYGSALERLRLTASSSEEPPASGTVEVPPTSGRHGLRKVFRF
jgi:hypothetical protein